MTVRDYRKYKNLVLAEVEGFNKFMEEVDVHANNLKQERFNKVFDTINEKLRELDDKDFKNLVLMISHDEDVSDEVGKIVETMYLIKMLGRIFDDE